MKTDKDRDAEIEAIINYRPDQRVSFRWAVKHILRDKANYDVIEGFLSEVLRQPVKIISFLKSINLDDDPLVQSDATYIVIEDKTGKYVLTEFTFTFDPDYLRKMMYNMCRTLVECAGQLRLFSPIKKFCSVIIVDLYISNNTDYLYTGKTDFTGVNNNDKFILTDTQRTMYDEIEVSDISPQYYLLISDNFKDIPENTLEEWLYFLKYEEIKEGFSAKGLLKAYDILHYDRLPDKDRKEYNREREAVIRMLYQDITLLNKRKTQEDKTISQKSKKNIRRTNE